MYYEYRTSTCTTVVAHLNAATCDIATSRFSTDLFDRAGTAVGEPPRRRRRNFRISKVLYTMSATEDVEVVVCGGGPAGMASALSLARLGFSQVGSNCRWGRDVLIMQRSSFCYCRPDLFYLTDRDLVGCVDDHVQVMRVWGGVWCDMSASGSAS